MGQKVWERPSLIDEVVRQSAYSFFDLFYRVYAGIKVVNTANVSGPAFLIANHESWMDPFIVCYPFRRLRISGPGKVELFRSRLATYVLPRVGIFPLVRGTRDVTSVRMMIERYRQGEVVVVFPEGTRSKTGEVQPFQPDFTRLVLRLRARLIPAGIAGSAELVPGGKGMPRRGVPVAVVYGEEFTLSEYDDRDMTPGVLAEAGEIMRARVAAMAAAAREERAGMRALGVQRESRGVAATGP